MHFTSLVATALMSTLSVAQMVDVQVVAVGKNPLTNETGLKFWPEKVTAKPGTMVQFQFWAGNHTVTQSSFDNPCIPIPAAATNGTRGIDSGYQPVAASAGAGNAPVFTIMVKDTKPMWLYCAQGPHCQRGMVMVINENTGANSTRSLDNYKGLAGAVPAPGGTAPGGGSGSAPGGGSGSAPGGGSGSTPGGETGTTPTTPGSGSGGDAGSGSGSGSPSDGTAPPSQSPPVAAAGRTAVGASSLLLALGASFLLL